MEIITNHYKYINGINDIINKHLYYVINKHYFFQTFSKLVLLKLLVLLQNVIAIMINYLLYLIENRLYLNLTKKMRLPWQLEDSPDCFPRSVR